MNTVEIKGREFHFIKRVINWQQNSGAITLQALLMPEEHRQWSEEFINNVERAGLVRFDDGRIYATDLAINSIKEKEKRESRLIEEYIIDDFEYAFLMFMDNRNEPVHLFEFPQNFKYHSKIDGQLIDGNPNLLNDWMSEIDMYITDPTIDGFILNHTGKTRYAKLKKDRKLKEDNELLDIEVKRQTIEGAKFSRNVAYVSLGVAAITAFVPLLIWWVDKDKTQKTETETPQLKQVMQNQQQTHQTLQNLQKTVYSLDTSIHKVKIVK